MEIEEDRWNGCITALVTPFGKDGEIDWYSFERLIEFQCKAGVRGILFTGTTGESPTLTAEEHIEVIRRGSELVNKFNMDTLVIGGTGSNNTQEAIEYTEAVQEYVDGILLVDSYYNKPNSRQLRESYYGPIIQEFPDLPVIPYVIPARTGGTGLMPKDLAKLVEKHPNVIGVKDAAGDTKRTIETRKLLPEPFKIWSGDDSATVEITTNKGIRGNGVVSVISNAFPYAVQKWTESLKEGWNEEISEEMEALRFIGVFLAPLFEIVTVKPAIGNETWPNPCGIKTLMSALKMTEMSLRQPLSAMDNTAVEKVRKSFKEGKTALLERVRAIKAERVVRKEFGFIENMFKVNIDEMLNSDETWEKLSL